MGWALAPMTCPYKEGTTWRYREGDHVTTEAEVGVMVLQATEHRELLGTPKMGERSGTDAPSEPSWETNSAHTSIWDFWSPES